MKWAKLFAKWNLGHVQNRPNAQLFSESYCNEQSKYEWEPMEYMHLY